MAATARWVVQCDDYTTKPLPTEAAARRMQEQIEQANRCRSEHRVVQVA